MKTQHYLALLALGTSLSAFAQQGITFTDTSVVIDLNKVCYERSKALNCDLSEFGVDMKLVGKTLTGNIPSSSTITSSMPIAKVSYSFGTYETSSYGNCTRYQYYGGSWSGTAFTGTKCEAAGTGSASFGENVFQISFATQYGNYPTEITLSTGVPSYLKSGLGGAGRLLKTSYAGVLRNVKGFQGEIAKSHRGHLARFTQALEEGIKLLEAVDKDQKPLYSVLDWRVQENSRLIVVFGTVLNELLTDYDDVARLQNSIKSMRILVTQLRESYGWNNGLAGVVSKASSSLIEVVRLEIQELASIKIAMGAPGFEIYTELLKVTRNLQAKVNASKSGDMKAQREIFDFVDIWNGKDWQEEMGRLMNAGPDFKNLVTPKLMMLVFAMESIAELSDQNFIIPDKAAINK